MEYAIRQVRLAMPIAAFKTATVDRGKEFACYSNEKSNLSSFRIINDYIRTVFFFLFLAT